MRTIARIAAAIALTLSVTTAALARSRTVQAFDVDVRSYSVAPATASTPATTPPPIVAPSTVSLRCRDHASASVAVHGGVLEVTESGRTVRAAFSAGGDARNRLRWFYAQGGVALASVTTFHPGASDDAGYEQLVAVDIASGRTLWTRRLHSWAPECYVVGGSIALSHGVGLELFDPRTGATTHPAVTVAGSPAEMQVVPSGRVLYRTSSELVMLDSATFRVLWRAPASEDQGVALAPAALYTVTYARTPAGLDASLTTRDLATGALVRTTPLTRYVPFCDSMTSSVRLRDRDHVEVSLVFIVLD